MSEQNRIPDYWTDDAPSETKVTPVRGEIAGNGMVIIDSALADLDAAKAALLKLKDDKRGVHMKSLEDDVMAPLGTGLNKLATFFLMHGAHPGGNTTLSLIVNGNGSDILKTMTWAAKIQNITHRDCDHGDSN